MTVIDRQTEERLRQGFKYFNIFMVGMWRLGFGRWFDRKEFSGQIMVLTQTGRKSGARRRTPVNYAFVDGELYCMAGFGAEADWFRNIVANPEVEVWLPEGWWAGLAEDVSTSDTRLLIMRQVLIASGFAARLAGLDPERMTNEEIASATANYCLVHIKRTRACTGPGGPGDLAWVWPLATMILLPLALRPRKRKT